MIILNKLNISLGVLGFRLIENRLKDINPNVQPIPQKSKRSFWPISDCGIVFLKRVYGQWRPYEATDALYVNDKVVTRTILHRIHTTYDANDPETSRRKIICLN